MFDRFVAGRRPSWKRRGVLIGSLLLHGGGAVALVIASVTHVIEIAPPPLTIVMMPSPPPAPSGSPKTAAARPKRPAPSVKARPTATVTQPMLSPPLAPAVEPTPATTADTTAPGGSGDENPNGKGGPGPHDSTGTGVDPDGRGPAVTSQVVRPKNVPPYALEAQRLAGASPHLPDFVKVTRRGLGDTPFLARVCVDQAGVVNHVEVMQGIPGADEAIVQTLRGWRYKPQPIPVFQRAVAERAGASGRLPGAGDRSRGRSGARPRPRRGARRAGRRARSASAWSRSDRRAGGRCSR